MACVALALAHSRTPIYPLRPKRSRAGLEMRRMLSLIESQGLVERRDRLGEDLRNEEGGRRDRAMERGQSAWPGDAEPINFPLQPISHVLSLCPFLLMTHFLCPSAHFQARRRKKKMKNQPRCVYLSRRCMFVCEGTPGG